MEKWSYELAKLYYKAGMEKECIQECTDLILWFGKGSYVEKAKLLKAYYSGEVDKDDIIENLKNRAAMGNIISETKEINVDQVYDEQEEEVLDQIAENMGREVDILLTKEQNSANDSQQTEEVNMDINQLIRTEDRNEDRNEDLEKLDKLSESLGVDIYQVFGNFMHIKSIQKQLVMSLELIMNKHTKSVQMIITGTPSSGKTTLAKDITVFLNKTGKLQTSRIAKITATKLNEIDLTSMREELRNSCLVIENASELKRPTIDKVLELIKYFRGDIAVIFEENKKNMNRLFRECPKLMELFKNRIHLPLYTENDLMGFAYAYILRKEYKLQPSAINVFENGIKEIIENTEKKKQLEEISKYIQNAMTSADHRTGKQLLATEGRLADVDILSLLPEDFIYQIIP
jgi:hypothetical protein